jgi:hypothetical protein
MGLLTEKDFRDDPAPELKRYKDLIELGIQSVEWTERPKPKHRREYTRWCHGVYSHLADRWNMRLMHVIEIGGVGEFWAYSPGEAPKRLPDETSLQS